MQNLDAISPGQTIGRYEFLVPIARGGMASVWAARLKGSRGFAKTVAIKIMLPDMSDNPMFEQMFLDEAQLAAQIHHPNVVEIMDLGEKDDLLYQVMEYVDGETVSALIRAAGKRDARIPFPLGVRIISDACSGLHAAHELRGVDGSHLGLVHRDISPQNIMVTYDGIAKLVDFGVAKAAGRIANETTAGQIKGKAPYMSPEQATGRDVDRRTDIFAMGIVLYQVTTGKHPFRGESDLATLHNILTSDVPSPRFVDQSFPRPLESVILKALHKDPDKRFATAADMARALNRVFPPTTRRPELSDIGAYVQDALGKRGARRRAALKEAISRADRRATRSGSSMAESSGSILLPLREITASGVGTAAPEPVAATAVISPPSKPVRISDRPETAPADSSGPSSGQSSTSNVVVDTPMNGPRPASTPPGRSSRKPIYLFAAAAITVVAIAGVIVLVTAQNRGQHNSETSTVDASTHMASNDATDSAPEKQIVDAGNESANGAMAPKDAMTNVAADAATDVDAASLDAAAAPAATTKASHVQPRVNAKATATATTAKPAASSKPTSAPTSTWKPPPVANPGF